MNSPIRIKIAIMKTRHPYIELFVILPNVLLSDFFDSYTVNLKSYVSNLIPLSMKNSLRKLFTNLL